MDIATHSEAAVKVTITKRRSQSKTESAIEYRHISKTVTRSTITLIFNKNVLVTKIHFVLFYTDLYKYFYGFIFGYKKKKIYFFKLHSSVGTFHFTCFTLMLAWKEPLWSFLIRKALKIKQSELFFYEPYYLLKQ